MKKITIQKEPIRWRETKIAFLPHKTRGEEIIKILEKLGGRNRFKLDGSEGIIAIDHKILTITNDWDLRGLIRMGWKIYTLEEWEATQDRSVSLNEVCKWLEEICFIHTSDCDEYHNPIVATDYETKAEFIRELRKAIK